MRETQDEFVSTRQPRWTELDHSVGTGRVLHRHDGPTIARIAGLYRSLCTDLTRARTGGYSASLVDYLDGLAARSHSALYGARPIRLPAFWKYLFVEFPQALRRNYKFFFLAFVLFYGPMAIGILIGLFNPERAMDIVPAPSLAGMVDAYSQGFNDGRATGADAGMAGFYVRNNIGIAFRCFATGIFFGVGSLFFLVYNGLNIGVVTGFVSRAGFGENILTFMCGHGPFELTAILISGAAGLRMGYALIQTDGATRIGSLRACRADIARLIVGAAAMLLIAAFIEGFWSPSAAPKQFKWGFAALMSVLVTGFLIFAGRGEAPRVVER